MTRKRKRTRTRRRGPPSSKNWKLLIGIAIGLAPVLMFGSVGKVVAQVQSDVVGTSTTTVQVNESLIVTREDAIYLNRIFKERNHEIGYCLAIDASQVSFWLADTVQASAQSLEMKTSNCPADMQDGTAHTHLNGRVGLSAQDKQTLFNQEPDIMCIHAGKVDIAPGTELENLVCYQETSTGSPMLITVRIALTEEAS